MAYSGFTASLTLGSLELERATVRWSETWKAPVVEFGSLTVFAHGEDLAAVLRRLADEVDAAGPSVSGVA